MNLLYIGFDHFQRALPNQIKVIKIIYYEKAITFEKITIIYIVMSKKEDDFVNILWPSQNMYLHELYEQNRVTRGNGYIKRKSVVNIVPVSELIRQLAGC